MSAERANPFADVGSELPAFTPRPRGSKPAAVPAEQVEAVAQATGFVSRQAPRAGVAERPKLPRAAPASRSQTAPAGEQYRYRTGRNQQINVKATPEDIERFQSMARARGVPLGELLRLALDALAATEGKP